MPDPFFGVVSVFKRTDVYFFFCNMTKHTPACVFMSSFTTAKVLLAFLKKTLLDKFAALDPRTSMGNKDGSQHHLEDTTAQSYTHANLHVSIKIFSVLTYT